MAKTTKTTANKTLRKSEKPVEKTETKTAAPPKSAANKSSDKKTDVAAYWTPERLRAATLHPALRTKKRKTKPKKRAKDDPSRLAGPALPSKRLAAAADPTYETELVQNVGDFPASTIGKIYLTMNGNDYFATGCVVGNRTILTVASVLWDRGSQQWANNVVFYPQYNSGPGAGLGAFDIGELWVAANWPEQGALLNDFGAIITTGAIAPFTGNVGVMANYPIDQGQYLVMGYPGTPVDGYPFDGERMWQCTAAYLTGIAWTIQAGSNLTYGAHGAPWLIFREGGWHANGIFAVQVVDPDSILSPYFGNEFWDFFTFLQGKGYV